MTSMRTFVLLIVVTICFVLSGFSNQQPQPAAQTAQPARAPAAAGQAQGDLRQVMRGVLFPNANVVFFAQDKNPADTKPAKDPALATDPLASAYGGWTAVENS